MKIHPSSIPGVELTLPRTPDLRALVPEEALPFTVVVKNLRDQAIAFTGLRFDLTGPGGRKYSVVHYADLLRTPEFAVLTPGTSRPFCAEPSYVSGKPDARSRMNLDNLRRMLSIKALLDCVAFADGRFEGPDTRGAFDRIRLSRESESEVIAVALHADHPREALEALSAGAAAPALARKLLDAGSEIRDAARAHRCRIELWRA